MSTATNNTVLIVDDERNICELIRLYVEKEGFTACTVYDGKSAVEKFREINPCIVLLDIMLPLKDGWQVCREIRAESNVPIIMLTARVTDSDKILGLTIGADDYITKPFNPLEVTARVKTVLRRCRKDVGESSEIDLSSSTKNVGAVTTMSFISFV